MKCSFKGCEIETEVYYYKKPVCNHHWCMVDTHSQDWLKKKLKVEGFIQLRLR